MKPAQIIFRHAPPSPAVVARIQQELDRLERHGAGIEHCRVVVEVPHPHRRHGFPYRIEIELHVRGKDIVVHHAPPLRRLKEEVPAGSRELAAEAAHKDVYVTIRDAFEHAARLLEDRKRRRVAAVRKARARASGPVPFSPR
ncbi:MAG TPA: HPF/RaiA family ribosome-associated protein [Opitutaceae bacterium]|nr:HPF/RaiA family ribosome-associated protein [Opitutaceae bacterium]